MAKGLSACLMVGLLAACLASASLAHQSRALPAGETIGVPIASVTHGEMRVLARYRAAIHDLATSITNPDPVLRKLLFYEEVEHLYCAWGLMPGSVTDEASPFNECSHAYLAADKQVLRHMAEGGEKQAGAKALLETLSLDLAGSGESLITCQFSAEAFNTASIVYPDLAGIPWHAASAVAVFLPIGIIAALYPLGRMRRRRAISDSPTSA